MTVHETDQQNDENGAELSPFRRFRLRLPLAALIVALLAHNQHGLAQHSGATSDDPVARFRSSLTQLPDTTKLTLRQGVYVPVYSSVMGAAGLARLDFSVTLSMRNVSEASALVIERIDYHDTAGALVERYLSAPIALRPLATIEIYIRTEDVRAGSGANFIVSWAATDTIAEPVIEAVMIGGSGTRGFAFVVPGRPIRTTAK